MGEESGSSKPKGGPFAVALAGLGALFARTADDCGRVAVKGASLGDDALRGASRVGAAADDGLRAGSKFGSLADDGLRNGTKIGSLADDGMRAGKWGTLADDGLNTGTHLSPHGETPGGLLEEASAAGSKGESHAGDIAENAVDISMEVISNIPAGDDNDDSDSVPSVSNDPSGMPKVDTAALLRERRVSQPAFLPVMPGSTKAFLSVLGRPNKPDEDKLFTSLRPTPDDGQPVLDPLQWLKGRVSHHPITIVFYTTDRTGMINPLPLVLPNGETTDDTTVHRACYEKFEQCVLLVCKPERAGYKQSCAKSASDAWQSVAITDDNAKLQKLLENLITKRNMTPALRDLTISRLDISTDKPRIVRSHLKTPKP